MNEQTRDFLETTISDMERDILHIEDMSFESPFFEHICSTKDQYLANLNAKLMAFKDSLDPLTDEEIEYIVWALGLVSSDELPTAIFTSIAKKLKYIHG